MLNIVCNCYIISDLPDNSWFRYDVPSFDIQILLISKNCFHPTSSESVLRLQQMEEVLYLVDHSLGLGVH